MVFLLLPLCPWVFNEKTVKAAQDFEDASVMDECGTLMPLFGAVFFDLNVGILQVESVGITLKSGILEALAMLLGPRPDLFVMGQPCQTKKQP